ncbi:hypothetical protein DPMN_016630 [Dreissena polymorpha]|uniref:Uncharacterized protein n=1 Tax=Dreissena polymorpha TaxID=45954 RepID=A0A9D4NG03_DREPO|nr:hypothetical protein DPMN_016630 [Dreissena polymorpha]
MMCKSPMPSTRVIQKLHANIVREDSDTESDTDDSENCCVCGQFSPTNGHEAEHKNRKLGAVRRVWALGPPFLLPYKIGAAKRRQFPLPTLLLKLKFVLHR